MCSGHTNAVSCCAFSHSSHWLVTGSWDKTLRVHNIATGTYRYCNCIMRDEKEERKKQARSNKQARQSNTVHPRQSLFQKKMKGTKVQTLGGRAVAGAWLVAWAIMAMGAIINTHAHR